MNLVHDNRGDVMEYDRRERRRLSARGIVEALSFVVYVLLGTTIISTIVAFLFAVSFSSAFFIVSGTLAAVLSAIFIPKSLKRKRARTGKQDSLAPARTGFKTRPAWSRLPDRTRVSRGTPRQCPAPPAEPAGFETGSRHTINPDDAETPPGNLITGKNLITGLMISVVPFFALVLLLLAACHGYALFAVLGTVVAVLSAFFFMYNLRHNRAQTRYRLGRITASIVPVGGVMATFLVLDFTLTALLQYLAVNIFLAHVLIMASGIVFGGITRFISERTPTITLSMCGGLFASFLLIVMVVGTFEGPPGRSEEAITVIYILLLLFFAALLGLCSYAVVSQMRRASVKSW
jgi:MFS family permease